MHWNNIQWGFSSAGVDVGGGSPGVVDKIRNTVYSEAHLPAFRKGLLIQQTEKQH